MLPELNKSLKLGQKKSLSVSERLFQEYMQIITTQIRVQGR